MSAPQLLRTVPGNNSTGWPIGESIVLDFDRSVDPISILDYIVLFGSDFDQTSGPDSILWVDQDTGNNPFFLRSPGFKGVTEIKTVVTYYDLDTLLDITNTFSSEADELAYGTAGVGSRVYITPTVGQLAPDTQYILNISGDPDSLGTTGISSKTVYDVVPNVANLSATSNVYVSGFYTGGDDVVIIDITTGGDIGTAKYQWYFQTDGIGTAQVDKLSNRRNRTLAKGLEIRFSGTDFEVGDQFTANVYASERLATATQITFTTNDGSYTTAPDSPSVPATSEPPSSIIPPAPGQTSDANLQILEMTPPDGAYNISTRTRTISILFDQPLATGTITNDAVRVYKYPVLGFFQGQPEIVELSKKLTVSGSTLTVEI